MNPTDESSPEVDALLILQAETLRDDQSKTNIDGGALQAQMLTRGDKASETGKLRSAGC